MRIVSWNVNGLRACHQKGFAQWLTGSGAQVVGLQEVRASQAQIPAECLALEGWHTHFSAAQRAGYSGVGFFSRLPFQTLNTSLEDAELDAEGRLILATFGPLQVATSYFPNGNGKNRDNSRIPFKLRYYRKLFEHLRPAFEAGERLLVMGDFNTAHTEIDLARPKENRETSGFRPEERAELSRWLDAGWVDTFRHFQPEGGHYSWWSQRSGARERNVGWRIDYVLASPGAMPFVRAASIHSDVTGSDHCPISVDLDPAILSPSKSRSPQTWGKAVGSSR